MCQGLFSKVKDFVLFLPRFSQHLETPGRRDTKKLHTGAFLGSMGYRVDGGFQWTVNSAGVETQDIMTNSTWPEVSFMSLPHSSLVKKSVP